MIFAVAKPANLSDITVRDATLEYLEILERRVMRSQLSAATLTSYRRDLLEFTTLLGPDTDLDSIEADDLEIALTTLAKSPDRRYRVGVKIAEDGSTPPGRVRTRSLAGSRPCAACSGGRSTKGMCRWTPP